MWGNWKITLKEPYNLKASSTLFYQMLTYQLCQPCPKVSRELEVRCLLLSVISRGGDKGILVCFSTQQPLGNVHPGSRLYELRLPPLLIHFLPLTLALLPLSSSVIQCPL